MPEAQTYKYDSVDALGQAVKKQYPDAKTGTGTKYADMSDKDLGTIVLKKYPEYQPQIRPERSTLGKVWDAATGGLIGPEALTKAATVLTPKPPDTKPGESYYQRLRREQTAIDPNHPIMQGVKSGLAGASADIMDLGSSLTSPASLAMFGAGAMGKVPGAIGKIAKGVSATGAGVFGAQGIEQAGEAALDSKLPTADRTQQILNGLAQGTMSVASLTHSGGVSNKSLSEAAREHATKIDTKFFGNRESGVAVSKAKLVGQLKNLATQVDPETGNSKPGLIRQELEATKQKTQQALTQASQNGAVVDFDTELKGMTDQALTIAATRDMATYQKAAGEIRRINMMVRSKLGGAPQSPQLQPINVKAIPVNEIAGYDMNGNGTGILKRLENPAFDKPLTSIAENYAKNLRMALGDKLDQVAPETKELRRQSANLIQADNTAMDMQKQAFAGLRRYVHGIWSKGPLDIGAFATLHHFMGLDWYSSAGSVVAARAIWDSAPSTTARAAAWRIVSDALEGPKRATMPLAQPGGGGAPTGPQLPVGGQPNAPAPAPNAGFPRPQVLQNQQVTSPPTAIAPTPMIRALPPSPTLQPETVATPNVTRVPEGASGASPKMKAMMDRVDVLQDRIDNPKSGQDATAARKELGELKKIISGEAIGGEEKRLQGRERVQKFRSKQASQLSPDQPTMTGSEPVARGGSPEQTLSAIEQGYQHLKSQPNGTLLAKTYKDYAKRAKLDSSQELDGIIEVIQFLKKNGATQ